MNIFSRTITGVIMIAAGLVLIGISFFTSFFVLIYGLLILIFGIIIFLNKDEDRIEQIKYSKKINKKIQRKK